VDVDVDVDVTQICLCDNKTHPTNSPQANPLHAVQMTVSDDNIPVLSSTQRALQMTDDSVSTSWSAAADTQRRTKRSRPRQVGEDPVMLPVPLQDVGGLDVAVSISGRVQRLHGPQHVT
jgi:hypothetical protein